MPRGCCSGQREHGRCRPSCFWFCEDRFLEKLPRFLPAFDKELSAVVAVVAFLFKDDKVALSVFRLEFNLPRSAAAFLGTFMFTSTVTPESCFDIELLTFWIFFGPLSITCAFILKAILSTL